MSTMKKREATSKQIASIAGRVLKDLEDENDAAVLYVNPWAPAGSFDKLKLTVGEVKALAASALTQKEK